MQSICQRKPLCSKKGGPASSALSELFKKIPSPSLTQTDRQAIKYFLNYFQGSNPSLSNQRFLFSDHPAKAKKPSRVSRYLQLVFTLFIAGYFFIQSDVTDLMSFLRSKTFVYLICAMVFISLFWSRLYGILEKVHKKQIAHLFLKDRQSKKQGAYRFRFLFPIIGYTFSISFSVMVMVFLLVAYQSGTGVTIVIWDHFGEMTAETILFVIAFFFVLIGYYYEFQCYKNYRGCERYERVIYESNDV